MVLGSGTILVIDDEEDVRNLAKTMLQQLGYNVYIALDGAEGLKIYKKRYKEIDLILLDMIMPGLTGVETFEEIQKINPKVITLLMSGYSQDNKAGELIYEGAKGFIQKPFRLQVLSKEIRQTLHRQE